MSNDMNSYRLSMKVKIAIYSLVTAIFMISLAWSLFHEKLQAREIMRNTALTSLKKDMDMRKWVASHGGVYVPVTKRTPANPHLSFLKNRDVLINDEPYTLMNPAYVIKQLTQEYQGIHGAVEHMISLNPLNPDNKAHKWEKPGLEAFEKGAKEFSEISRVEDQSYYRYMKPLLTERECLKCHGQQGYKVGDVRGALSISIPMDDLSQTLADTAPPYIVTHVIFYLMMLTLIYFFIRKLEQDTAATIEKKSLMESNLYLKEVVDKEIAENRVKDQILYQQAKSAQMGQMVNMIAHQWRQPLNAMSASAIALLLRYSYGELEKNQVEEHTKFIQDQTSYMSTIINDFMNFLRPEHEQSYFSLHEVYQTIGSLIEAQLHSSAIEMVCEECGDTQIYTFKKELEHVLLNLIINARDAFDGQKKKNKVISLSFEDRDDEMIICVKDSAGGIPEAIMPKIFDSYFTTKEAGKGTGIGLYMTKRIVEDILHGIIEVKNENGGAVFTIRIKKSQ